MKQLLALLVILVLVGCAPKITVDTGVDTSPGIHTIISDRPGWGPAISRYIDREAGVVCYTPHNGRAIYCMPISSTNLR